MPLLNKIVTRFTANRIKEIEYFMQRPIEVQQNVFQSLIKSAITTEWGKKFGFNNFTKADGIKRFKEIVPVMDYDAMKPFVDRIQKGEQDIFWPGKIKWIAKSSGTTSDKSKFIPVSKEALLDCHYKGGKDVLALYTHNFPGKNVLSGKSLIIGGSQQSGNFENDCFYGDLSAVLVTNLPIWAQYFRTPKISIALMSEWEQKIEQMAKNTINENVTSIVGVPSWTLVLIKHIFKVTGKNNLLDIWPNLELFAHGGVSFVPYRDQYKKIIPSSEMNYMETYNASEGFFSIQNEPLSDDMLLMLDYGVYYEFIPAENAYDPWPRTVELEDIEIGKNYALLISTNGGLWRYLIGDTVTFTSKYPFKIKISGRTKHFINAFGEEVIIDNAEKALKKACEATNALVREYTAGPIYMNENQKGRHEWLIEFEREPENLQQFVDILDSTLKSVNSDYDAKRYKNLSLDLPLVKQVKRGVFYSWLKEKGRLGGQNKIPRLFNNRKYLDEIIEINEKSGCQ